MQRAEADAQILICYDGSNDAEHAIDAAAALFGPRRAVLLSHDVATHARRPVPIVPPPTQGAA
jgi:hypothetical protein